MNQSTKTYLLSSLCLFLFLFATNGTAQKSFDATQIALNHLKLTAKAWQLTDADVADVAVQNTYKSDHNGVTHVFLMQQFGGIEVYNALCNVHVLPSGEVLYAGNRFVSHLKVNATKPILTPSKALSIAAYDVGLSFSEKIPPLSISGKNTYIFEENSISHQKMTVKLLFYPNTETGAARLAWDLTMDAVNSDNYWTMRIDALTGAVLDKKSLTVHCSFDDHFLENQETNCPEYVPPTPLSKNALLNPPTIENMAGKGTYRVFQLPLESPLYGNTSLVDNPADSLASPFGWHDTTGTVGPEFTITRGNNAHAFLDTKNLNRSSGGEPDGGPDLIFDHPYSAFAAADSQKSAALVNLFYMNNVMHDVSFRYGFNEVAGNYQEKNYSGQGKGNDYVFAQAQFGGKLPDPALNNASFAPPADGASGRMRMYLWGRRGLRNLTVSAPESLSGTYATGIATFGPPIPFAPISGKVVLFNDGSTKPTEACLPSKINLAGKIVMIDRGTAALTTGCSYGRKIINAQDSGAIAALVCYNLATTPSAFNDTLDAVASQVRIPAVILSSTDCNRLRLGVGNDLQAALFKQVADTVGVEFIDGDFENGIIAHEYGHGISTRLTGGPANSSCLQSGEQMGEGWSDFFSMIMTAKPGDRGNMARGIGNFVLRLPADGKGIRRYPYSTDMSINPHTYNNIYLNQAAPHPIGEIWATTIWDLYWALTDKYGWDADIKNRNSGNGKAIQLVMDGMKLQPCNPGFLDGRDAILAADRANYGGENQCLIWSVFARRGMGYSAKQGLGSKATDNAEAFDVLPSCLKTLKMTKTMSPNVNAGETFDVSLKIINHKGLTVNGLSLVDKLPTGAGFVSVLAPTTGSVAVAGDFFAFAIQDSLKNGDSLEIKYRLRSNTTKVSTSQLFEDFEKTTSLMESNALVGAAKWGQAQDTKRPLGKTNVMVANASSASEQTLTLTQPFAIRGTQPTVRFLHRFNAETGLMAGAFEVYIENDTGWRDLSSYMFRNEASGPTYLTFPFKIKAFWGVQDSFLATYIDMKEFVGKNVQVRFRFKSGAALALNGWSVDDLLFFDMANYQSTARLTSAQRDTVLAESTGRGTIVEPTFTIPTKEIGSDIRTHIYPNPTTNVLNISIETPVEWATISIMSIEGKVLFQEKTTNQQNWIPLPIGSGSAISMGAFPTGLYFLKIETDKGNVVRKIVKN
jgi:extracellular elastinolytic metalloproteinase